jgi:hypothetical protein
MRRGSRIVIIGMMAIVTMLLATGARRREKPGRQMYVIVRMPPVTMTGQSFITMRMMRTAAQQQVQAEGEQRDECDEVTHWILPAGNHLRLLVANPFKSMSAWSFQLSSGFRYTSWGQRLNSLAECSVASKSTVSSRFSSIRHGMTGNGSVPFHPQPRTRRRPR